MLQFLECQEKSQVKKVFLVHGDYEAQSFYRDKMVEAGFGKVEIPEAGNEFELE